MIRGEVNAAYEAVIPVTLRAANGQDRNFEAVIDTGFSGYLTLNPVDIAALQLPFQQRQTFLLGDNRQVEFDIYLATIIWDGSEIEIAVLASNSGTLVGMKLLRGYHLFVEVVDGGEVRIETR